MLKRNFFIFIYPLNNIASYIYPICDKMMYYINQISKSDVFAANCGTVLNLNVSLHQILYQQIPIRFHILIFILIQATANSNTIQPSFLFDEIQFDNE